MPSSDVPLPPTRRRQESRNTNKRPGSSSARAVGEPGMSFETADREPGSSNTSITKASRRHKKNTKGSRGTSRSSSRSDERPAGSSSARAVEESDIEPGSSDAMVTEDDLTPAEKNIPDTQLLGNLGEHPSVFARAGLNPLTQGLSFRGAWKRAVDLYRVANDQYKQLFSNAGFGDFLKIDPVELPQGYVIALMERWFPETNTLHLPCCEIGPTPVDWTMITGMRFGGERIKLKPNYDIENVQELLGVGGISGEKTRLSVIKPTRELVEAVPPSDEAKARIFRRLFLYVIGGCFFGNNQSVIHHGFVEFLVDINNVGRYDWGSITYAAFLTGMRRKVTREIGSFTGFWQFLPFWAFEYLNICRPEHADVNDIPRATRWKFPQNLGTLDNSELTASRCQLDYVDSESKVTWQPYLASEKYKSGAIYTTILLANSRVPFLGLDTWEYYLGERCQRQLGLPCLVPSDPPETMYRIRTADTDDDTSMEISAQNLVIAESLDYASWFAANSIGKIVDVTRLIGGTDIGRKVMGDWMAKQRPGMILVPESEVEGIIQGRNAADAECKKLREELSRARRGSDS